MSTRPLDAVDLVVVHHQGPGSRPLRLDELDRDHRRPGRWGAQRADGSYPMPPHPGGQYHRVVHLSSARLGGFGGWRLAHLHPLEDKLWHAGARNRAGWSRVNTRSVAVCVLAPLEGAPIDPTPWGLLVEACADLVEQLPAVTVDRIVGHGDVARTGCPGSIDLADLRAAVEAELVRRARLARASRGVAVLSPTTPTA